MADDQENPREKKQTAEELQAEILQVELQTKKLLLAQARRDNAAFVDGEKKRRDNNRRRMAELAEMQRNHAATVKACRHKSGGDPSNILKGGGIGSFSIISRAVMPDGVTILLQCPRCRMLRYPPPASMKKAEPEKYLAELAEYNRLLEESRDNGIQHAEMRGPTFFFQTGEGVPFVPERK